MGCHCSRNQARTDAVRPATDRKKSQSLATSNSGLSDIRDFYKLGPVLGSGSFGQVRVCLHRKTELQYACKIMAKNPGKSRRSSSQPVSFVNMFKNEMNILRSLNHPNVVKLVETFEDRHFLYAIMEKCDGGELFTKIVKKRRFSEVEASALCREMIAAIAYIHSKHIVHRDVKAENFLFSKTNTHHGRLVLIDFGMSVQLTESDRYLRQVCGSPHYVAPELIRRYYKKEVDLWALGVVVFLMLYGRYPFEGADQKSIAQKILKSEPDYQRSSTPPSDLAVKFIKGLLEKDPAKRMTPQEAMRHPWVVRYADQSVTSMGTGFSSGGRSPLSTHLRRASNELIGALPMDEAALEGVECGESVCDATEDEIQEEGIHPPTAVISPHSNEDQPSDDAGVVTAAPLEEASYILQGDPGDDRDGSNEDLEGLVDPSEADGELDLPNVYSLDSERTPWDSDDDAHFRKVNHSHRLDGTAGHKRVFSKHDMFSRTEVLPPRRITANSLGAVSASERTVYHNGAKSSGKRSKLTQHRAAAIKALKTHKFTASSNDTRKKLTASRGRMG